MQPDIIEFLQQSNYIENEFSSEALDDAVAAWNYIMSKPTLNKGRILHIHSMLMKTRDIPEELKGEWRHPTETLSGNVSVGGHVKPHWKFVPIRMEDFIIAVNNSLKSKYVKSGEQMKGTCIAMHVTFENIHPFIDGNGRVGRILMNWQMQKFGLPVMVIKEEDKQSYYKWFN